MSGLGNRCTPGVSWGAMQTVQAGRIDRVRIFRRGARVTRSLVVECIQGQFPSRVAIPNLPLAVEDGSVAVRVLRLEEEGELPVARGVRLSLDVGASDPSLLPARDLELEEAELESNRLRVRLDACLSELNELARLTVLPRERAEQATPGPIPTQARLQLVEFRRSRERDLVRAASLLYEQWQKAEQQRRELAAAVAGRSNARQLRDDQLRKIAYVELSPCKHAAARATLELEYAIPGVRWA